MLPNLIVIGAARSGTTSLHRYLDLHPDISMSAVKELDFFVAERNWSRGIRWYEKQVPDDARIRGESSTSYTMFPRYARVPERMVHHVPDARLIYLVRDPIDRVVSHFRFLRYTIRWERKNFADAVRDFEVSSFVVPSRYAFQLDQYLPHFPLSRILVLDQTDLAHRPTETIRQVFRFLDVDATFTHPDLERRHNETEGLHANAGGRAAMRVLDHALGRHRSLRLRARLPRTLVRPLQGKPDVPEVEIDPDLRAELERYLKADADRLRSLTGRRFESWCV